MSDKYDDAGMLIRPTVKLELRMDIEYIKNCLLNDSASAVRDELIVLVDELETLRTENSRLNAVIDEANAQEHIGTVSKVWRDSLMVDRNPNAAPLEDASVKLYARQIPAQPSPEVAVPDYKEELFQLRQKAENWSTKLGFITSAINSRKISLSDKEREFPHLLIERLHTDSELLKQRSEAPRITEPPAVSVPDEWRESLYELVSAMNEYELSVDERAPHKHKKMMEKANRLLSSSHIDSTEKETNYCALKSITDSEVSAVTRAFWRRIYAYRNDYGIELPKPLPVEFMAHMATALTWVDRDPSPRIIGQDALEIVKEFVSYWEACEMAVTVDECFDYWAATHAFSHLLNKLNKVNHESN